MHANSASNKLDDWFDEKGNEYGGPSTKPISPFLKKKLKALLAWAHTPIPYLKKAFWIACSSNLPTLLFSSLINQGEKWSKEFREKNKKMKEENESEWVPEKKERLGIWIWGEFGEWCGYGMWWWKGFYSVLLLGWRGWKKAMAMNECGHT